ncbi:MAG: AAA family ATPase [Brevefilum sp.]|jgi:DNA-binding SARP family transcriptional activator/tetratricopeptide (TPR) repeat protein
MDTSALILNLLGPVEMLYQGQPLRLKRRVERAILYFLAVENRPISRSTLIDLFWSNKDGLDQRGALRTALSRLRKQLPDPNWIVSELDQVWIRANILQIDVFEFEYQFLNLHHTLSTFQENIALPHQMVNQIQEVLAMWQGDTFIEGDDLSIYPEFENWRQNRQWKLGYFRRFLLKRLADHYNLSGKLEESLDLYLQLASLDLLSTELHLTILDLLLRLGQHQDFVEYCDMLEAVYEKEFNTPLPEAILAKCKYSQILAIPIRDQNQRKWPSAPTIQVNLIGRQAELDKLHNYYRKGGLVVLRGELGSGKTRLVQELFQTLDVTPSLFVAPALDMENAMPFSPIIYALRQHITEDAWRALDPVWAKQLSLLIPELVDIRDDIQLAQSEVETQALFNAILHLLRLTSQRYGRMIFLLDNAHWVDKQTAQLITYIVSQKFFSEYGLLIIAYRPEENSLNLDSLLGQLYRDFSVHQIMLEGLFPAELGLLVKEVWGTLPTPPMLAQLVKETNGNPLLTLEIIHTIQGFSDGNKDVSNNDSLPLPESIRAIFRERLNRLDDRARHTLLCAAILGNSFSPNVLAKIAPMESSSETEVIDTLIRAGMLQSPQSNNHHHNHIQFTYEKIREVVLTEASPSRIQLIHRQVAEYLESEPEPLIRASAIAQHYLAGNDVSKAFRWLLQAANYAWEQSAMEDAVEIYQQAEDLVQSAPDDFFSINDIFRLYRQWSELAYQANQRDMLEQVALKLQFLGEKYRDPLLIGVSKMALANVCFMQFNFELSLEYIADAIKNLERTDARKSLIHAIIRQGHYFCWMNMFEETIECARKARSLTNLLTENPPEKETFVLYVNLLLGMTHIARGELFKALDYADIILSNDLSSFSPINQVSAYFILSHAYFLSGQYSDCEKFASEGMKKARAFNNEFFYETLLILCGKVKFIKGDLDAAFALATEAKISGQKNATSYTMMDANSLLGDIFHVLNEPLKASQHYRMAKIRSGYLKNSPRRLHNEIRLAHLLAGLGQLSEARDRIEQVFVTTQTLGVRHLYSSALSTAGKCDLFTGDLVSAEQNFAHAFEIAKENSLYFEMLISKMGKASVKLAEKKLSSADQLIREILIECEETEHVWLRLNALSLQSQLCQAQSQAIPPEYQLMWKSLIDNMEKHAQTEPVKASFDKIRPVWEALVDVL